MEPMQDKHLLAAWRQGGNALLEPVYGLTVGDGLGDVRARYGDAGGVGLPGIDMGLAGGFGAVTVNRAMGGDVPEEGERLGHLAGGRPFEQLDADILEHVAGKVAVAKAAADVIDQFVVMAQQCSKQRGMGGVAQHGQDDGKRRIRRSGGV